jgi:hypothetical protein
MDLISISNSILTYQQMSLQLYRLNPQNANLYLIAAGSHREKA